MIVEALQEETLKERFDVAVVGSGFAGTLLAMIAQQIGLRVILLERHRHPRIVIGESSTPLSNLLLEELAIRYGLNNLVPLTKWGSWQTSHPDLPCGLKRGFSFFYHGEGRANAVERENQLIVAASPFDQIADTHWYRAGFDAYLVQEAQRLGVLYLDGVELREFAGQEHESQLRGIHAGREIDITAKFVVDATGPRGFLHHALGLGERELPYTPPASALYSHFSHVRRLSDTGGVELSSMPPIPIDDAAVHHLFDGGWIWVLHFNNGITSAGIAATEKLARTLRLQEGEAAWLRILRTLPVVNEQFREAQRLQPFRQIPRLGFRSAATHGRGWVLLPSASGFVDPLLSTGFPLTLLGISRLAETLENHWQSEDFTHQLDAYGIKTDAELMATANLIGALYANLANFPVFAAVSLLYFAAVSYAETCRRLGRPQLASSFLLQDHPHFGRQCARTLERARSVQNDDDSRAVIEEARCLIEPIDLIGLGSPDRQNWFPADTEELLCNAYKVGASRAEVSQMLERCGFSGSTSSHL